MSLWNLKHISVGATGAIWGAGAMDGTLLRLYSDAGLTGWNATRHGRADIVAAIDGGEAWCVTSDHEIWHAVDAHLPTGGRWYKVPTQSGLADAQTISVGVVDGSVWYAQTDGRLFWRDRGRWQAEPTGRAMTVAAISKSQIWGINSAHEIWHLDGTWSKVATHSGKADAVSIAVGVDGSVWCVQADGTLCWRDGGVWRIDPAVRATVVAAYSQDDLWCLDATGEVWHKFGGLWSKDIDTNRNEVTWTYTVKQHEHLLGIVHREFNLTDKYDNSEVDRILGLLVAQNPHITRETIRPHDVLRLRYEVANRFPGIGRTRAGVDFAPQSRPGRANPVTMAGL
ncbi:MAG: hypothetical protein JNL73_18720 [Anaerolineales bacterium]|nr:hypothetical protein [Anaerolineales bacterium]